MNCTCRDERTEWSDSAPETFEKFKRAIEDLDGLLTRVVRSHGCESITLQNGKTIKFRTRTRSWTKG